MKAEKLEIRDEIVVATIRPVATPFRDYLNAQEVWVKLRSGKEQKLFEFHGDEITFRPPEFIGLIIAKALVLKKKKEQAFVTTKAAERKDLLRGKLRRQSDVRAAIRTLGRRTQ